MVNFRLRVFATVKINSKKVNTHPPKCHSAYDITAWLTFSKWFSITTLNCEFFTTQYSPISQGILSYLFLAILIHSLNEAVFQLVNKYYFLLYARNRGNFSEWGRCSSSPNGNYILVGKTENNNNKCNGEVEKGREGN